MAFVVTVAFLNGALNIINKMVNVRAKQVLGMANGTLINYLEGTVLALALALLAGDRHLAQPGYLGSIPFLYYLGGVFGLVGAGVWWNNRQSQRAAQEAAGETAPSAR